jgi:hypothetical protein
MDAANHGPIKDYDSHLAAAQRHEQGIQYHTNMADKAASGWRENSHKAMQPTSLLKEFEVAGFSAKQ